MMPEALYLAAWLAVPLSGAWAAHRAEKRRR